jgi:hypothetical protein
MITRLVKSRSSVVAKNALTSFAAPRRYIKKSGPELKLKDTASYARIAMITMSIILSANSVSKSTPTTKMNRMIPNGLGVTNVRDG